MSLLWTLCEYKNTWINKILLLYSDLNDRSLINFNSKYRWRQSRFIEKGFRGRWLTCKIGNIRVWKDFSISMNFYPTDFMKRKSLFRISWPIHDIVLTGTSQHNSEGPSLFYTPDKLNALIYSVLCFIKKLCFITDNNAVIITEYIDSES